MRLSSEETRNDPKAVLYSRCTIDLPSRDVRLEDVPCRNLEEVLGGVGRSLQFLANRTVTNAYTPENPLIVNTGIFTGSSVMTGLRTYFSSYSPLKVSGKGLPGVAFTPLQVSPAWNSSSAVRLLIPASYTVVLLSPTVQAARCVFLSTDPWTGRVISVSAL